MYYTGLTSLLLSVNSNYTCIHSIYYVGVHARTDLLYSGSGVCIQSWPHLGIKGGLGHTRNCYDYL